MLLPPAPDERAIPASVYNVAAQLLAAEQGIDNHPACVRTHLAGGFWLLGLLATGRDTRAMARQMSLSEHTIQDHFKSIFAKTGARDRVTVLSHALGTRT